MSSAALENLIFIIQLEEVDSDSSNKGGGLVNTISGDSVNLLRVSGGKILEQV